MTTPPNHRAPSFETAEDAGSNPSTNPTLGDVIAARLSRRDLMSGLLAVTAVTATVSPVALMSATRARAQETKASASAFNFAELAAGSDETHHVAEGYDADVLIRWGDKVLSDAPAFDPKAQTGEAQAKQFGYNNDFLGYIPLEGKSDHGLLVVNHEYTNRELMFPGVGLQQLPEVAYKDMTPALVAIEMMAHGGSVIEVKKADGKWAVVADSKYARRITPETEMRLSGPVAGHERLKTKADPSGTLVKGMLNNCGGATTPWGTWLSCEENFNGYFWNKAALAALPPTAQRPYARYGVPSEWFNWGQTQDRFDIAKEPNEANRFGWVVEIDPLDPASMPVKRTALGRFKHEGAGNIVNKDGRFVVYQGDDERFDYVYRFVTRDAVDTKDRAKNKDILDFGTLAVARFEADGTGRWIPLVLGQGGWITPENGFATEADIRLDPRLAADMVGATKMDRPEDVEVNPVTGKVYVMLTNNNKREKEGSGARSVNAANPRPENLFGHIIEITAQDGDHAAEAFAWEFLVKCGDPNVAEVGAVYSSDTTKNGWFGMPDNCSVDTDGRLWVATDGNSLTKTGRADGIWAVDTEKPARGTSKLFFRVPNGAEMCGPCFTPDMATFFVAVQHPGEDDADPSKATFEAPTTRWPDFAPDMPPRPSVVAITKKGGGKIGV